MNNLDEILFKHFEGTASAEEEALVQNWRNANNNEYQVLKKAWHNFRPGIETINFNTAKAWENVAKQTTDKTKVINLFSHPVFKYGMAASILFAIGFLMFLKFGSQNQDQNTTLAYSNTENTVKEVALPDGSKVWLNKSSRLVYNTGNKEQRAMSLSGEAFFEVQKDAVHPFVISCNQLTVTVLGTSFNVDADSSINTVSVKTGLVKLESKSQTEMLKAGQMASTDITGYMSPQNINANYLSWKTGEFIFENATLQDIVTSLNTFYNNRFECNSNACKITARFNNSTIEDIEKTIELTCGQKAKHVGEKIIFQ